MENLLKTQFIQLTLILGEFENHFNIKSSEVKEMYDVLSGFVESSRKMMINKCLHYYLEYDNQKIFADEIDLMYNINSYLKNYTIENPFYVYLNSMFDIAKDIMNEFYKEF